MLVLEDLYSSYAAKSTYISTSHLQQVPFTSLAHVNRRVRCHLERSPDLVGTKPRDLVANQTLTSSLVGFLRSGRPLAPIHRSSQRQPHADSRKSHANVNHVRSLNRVFLLWNFRRHFNNIARIVYCRLPWEVARSARIFDLRTDICF